MRKFTFIATLLMASASFLAQAQNWHIRGEFNNFNPNGESEWAFTESEEEAGVFIGTFSIPAEQFEFNFLNPDGNVFVPFNSKSFDSFNQTVEFTDGVFTGNSTLAWDDYEEGYMWKNPSWEGGKLQITIFATSNNPKVEFVKLPDEGSSSVKALNNAQGSEAIYNINGVKINAVNSAELPSGLYIINGKKVIVKK